MFKFFELFREWSATEFPKHQGFREFVPHSRNNDIEGDSAKT